MIGRALELNSEANDLQQQVTSNHCDIAINQSVVSRIQCRIRFDRLQQQEATSESESQFYLWQICDGSVTQPSTNGTYFNLSDYRFRSQREPSLKYPLLQSVRSESSGVNDGLPFYYRKGGQKEDKKKLQKQLESYDPMLPNDQNDYEIIKISDTYFKFQLVIPRVSTQRLSS